MKKRSIAVAILLTIITCGLYAVYWFVKLTDEVNYVSNTRSDTSGIMAMLLALVTCGIYTLYWSYKMGEKLDRCTGQNSSRGTMYLLLNLVGAGIINFALIQDTLNKML